MISKHGAPLISEGAQSAHTEYLAPWAFLVTPNLHEASILARIQVNDLDSMKEAAKRISALGPKSVLVKGGHLAKDAIDILYWQGDLIEFSAPRLDTIHTHGTGCTFSAAITAELAKGKELTAAVERAKKFITRAIQSQPGLGKGIGPVNHHAEI
jgi:hydroxymethylpyrimidine/phosphomethylpyrimidine kinase